MSIPVGPRPGNLGVFALVGAWVLIALCLGGPAAGPALGSTAPQWSITPTPNSTTFDGLIGVSCLSAADCWAVGTANPTASLIEHWNGTAWTLVPAAAPVPESPLEAVDCVDTSDCWAVGRTSSSGSNTVALTEHWDGKSWTTVSSPPVPGSNDTSLFGVTCASSADCWSVGSYFTSVEPPATQTLAEHWDGTDWTIVATPSLPGNQYNFLNATTCLKSDDCWAVGDTASFGQTLAEHWDGTSWSTVPTPNTASAGNDLNGVSCVSATDCWATGQGAPQALAERWNGRRWSIASTPTPSGGSSFGDGSSGLGGNSVVCVSAKKCWAVGYAGHAAHALVEQWTGTSWKIARTVKPTGSTFSDLFAVTCAGRGTCWAVGLYDVGQSQDTLAEVH
jgi:hypothetical protein